MPGKEGKNAQKKEGIPCKRRKQSKKQGKAALGFAVWEIFSSNFPAIFPEFPREPPSRAQKQPQPSRVFWIMWDTGAQKNPPRNSPGKSSKNSMYALWSPWPPRSPETPEKLKVAWKCLESDFRGLAQNNPKSNPKIKSLFDPKSDSKVTSFGSKLLFGLLSGLLWARPRKSTSLIFLSFLGGIPCFFRLQGIPCFLSVFPFFPNDFRVRLGRRILVFSVVLLAFRLGRESLFLGRSPCFLPKKKKQGKEDQRFELI